MSNDRKVTAATTTPTSSTPTSNTNSQTSDTKAPSVSNFSATASAAPVQLSLDEILNLLDTQYKIFFYGCYILTMQQDPTEMPYDDLPFPSPAALIRYEDKKADEIFYANKQFGELISLLTTPLSLEVDEHGDVGLPAEEQAAAINNPEGCRQNFDAKMNPRQMRLLTSDEFSKAMDILPRLAYKWHVDYSDSLTPTNVLHVNLLEENKLSYRIHPKPETKMEATIDMYDLALKPSAISGASPRKRFFYLEAHAKENDQITALKYTVTGTDNKSHDGILTKLDLKKADNFKNPLDLKELRPLLPQIFTIALERKQVPANSIYVPLSFCQSKLETFIPWKKRLLQIAYANKHLAEIKKSVSIVSTTPQALFAASTTVPPQRISSDPITELSTWLSENLPPVLDEKNNESLKGMRNHNRQKISELVTKMRAITNEAKESDASKTAKINEAISITLPQLNSSDPGIREIKIKLEQALQNFQTAQSPARIAMDFS